MVEHGPLSLSGDQFRRREIYVPSSPTSGKLTSRKQNSICRSRPTSAYTTTAAASAPLHISRTQTPRQRPSTARSGSQATVARKNYDDHDDDDYGDDNEEVAEEDYDGDSTYYQSLGETQVRYDPP